ncbi:UNVERIFIED_CONTAM: hypothetical protein Sangu_3005900 [Sesamum angustifolium]|uniref:Aminotransferase-like plant mobile domain-containing protein n=1 Tax=Sesamum angustifolium TaxID=2727405 RepID=A0AAW2KM33_9LAMI
MSGKAGSEDVSAPRCANVSAITFISTRSGPSSGGIGYSASSGSEASSDSFTKESTVGSSTSFSLGAPYGAMWNCEHTFTRTVRTTVRVIRDILDEIQYDQPYDMESNVIMAYAGDNPQLWRSICPLIFYAIVKMHHPERVLCQFGMMQNIPDQPDTRDMSLHKITRSNRTGTDWILQHILYITRWQRRYDTVIQRQPISNRRDTDRGYWEWYNNKTGHFVSSSTDRRVESGYQPGDAPVL